MFRPTAWWKSLAILMLWAGILVADGWAQPPIWHWRFDEAILSAKAPGDAGNAPVCHGKVDFAPGVKGQAIQLDGLSAWLAVPRVDISPLRRRFSVEAWVAHQTYSWSQTAILDASIDRSTGFRLTTDTHGRPIFCVAMNGKWTECAGDQPVALLEWAHVVATFDEHSGLRLYLNGRQVGSADATHKMSTQPAVDLLMGHSRERLSPVHSVEGRRVKSPMLFDGRIDELKVYGRALSEDQVAKLFTAIELPEQAPLHWRRMPTGPKGVGPFGAYPTNLTYSPGWDRIWRVGPDSDVLVRFDRMPVKMMFWRGANYGAVWVAENGLLMGDQSLERVGPGKSQWGCCEHMSDKQCRYSSVRIVENHAARVVLRWRYALSDVQYHIFGEDPITRWGEWAEEEYVVYPDGVSTRKQTLWSDLLQHEWQETLPLHQPGSRPEDSLEDAALTLANMDGDTHDYSWVDGSQLGPPLPADATIQLTNLRSRYRPFLILRPGTTIRIKPGVDYLDRGTWYQWWNHWPVAQIPSPGIDAVTHDRPSHSHLSQTIEGSNSEVIFHDKELGTFTAVHLIGMTDKPITDLVPLARSWNFPPKLELVAGDFRNAGYDRYERAYRVERQSASATSSLKLSIAATEASPLNNPAIVIHDWGEQPAVISVNGVRPVDGDDVRLGLRRRLEGTDLVIWFALEATDPVEIAITTAAM